MILSAIPATVKDDEFGRVAVFRECRPTVPLGSTDDLSLPQGLKTIPAPGTCGENGGVSKTSGKPCKNKVLERNPRCRLHPHTHVEIDADELCHELRVTLIDHNPKDPAKIQPKDIMWIDCPDKQCFYLYPIVEDKEA